MAETIQTVERLVPLAEIAHSIAESTPKLVGPFTPSNANEQKVAFLQGGTDHPEHHYGKLNALELEALRQTQLEARQGITAHGELSPVYMEAYEKALNENENKIRLLEIARQYKASSDEAERHELKREYRRINVELYGEPDTGGYGRIIADTQARCAELTMTHQGPLADIANDLSDLLPTATIIDTDTFTPHQETVEWVQQAGEVLYGGLRSHVDTTKQSYTAAELRDLFEVSMRSEFGEAVNDWQVVLSEEAKSIEVMRLDKQIVIPANRQDADIEKVIGLIDHELGVHLLRTISGEQTDLTLLRTGLASYADTEEGLGVVMEQARSGSYKPAGVDMFLAASLAHKDDMNFRGVFEILWRKKLVDNDSDCTDEAIDQAKAKAYGVTQRIFRGTDELPWLKDTTYFMGARKIWQYLESIRGDDMALTLMMVGKTDPVNPGHRRIVLEARSL